MHNVTGEVYYVFQNNDNFGGDNIGSIQTNKILLGKITSA